MTYRGALVAAMVSSAALLLAACGSSSPSASTGSGSSGTTTKLTKAPIVIGQVVSITGFAASSNAYAAKASVAWEDWVNSHGGIDGHPVKLYVMDDQSEGSVALAASKKLVTDDHVIAIVGNQDPTADQASFPYYESQNIASIGGFPEIPQWFTSSVAFPIGQTTADGVKSTTQVLAAAGKKNIALVACAETPACLAFQPYLEAYGPPVGIQYIGSILVSSSATNYTAQCIKLKQESVTVLQMATTAATTQYMVQDCAQQTYTPTFYFPGNAFNPPELKIPNLIALGNNYTMPFFSEAPQLKTFHEAMAAAGDTSSESVTAMDTWVAFEMFQKAMENYLPTISGNPTAADVFKAMYTVKDETLGGLLPQGVTYTASSHHPSMTCVVATGIQGGKYTLPSGLKSICT